MTKRNRRGKSGRIHPPATASPQALPARRRWRWGAALAGGVIIVSALLVLWWQSPWGPGKPRAASPGGVTTATSADASDTKVFAAYAGSASCRECHADEFQQWSKSHHGLAERAPQPALDGAAFKPARAFGHGLQEFRVASEGGKYQVTARGLSGGAEVHPVVRVIGHDPLRQFLVPAGGGRMQTLQASYDPAKNDWFDVFDREDREPGEWGHWTGRGMTWNAMCASCHNTRLRKNYDEATDAYHTRMAEMSVGCEACHGPMADHTRWQRGQSSASASQRTDTKDPTLHPFTRDQTVATCASCHSRRTELTGDFIPGDSYFDHYLPSTVDASDTYYPDGQVHEEDYEFSAFMGSKMYTAGVRCIDCHSPHTGKTILPGNALCMKCHAGGGQFPKAPVINFTTHSFHQPGGAGGQCVNCHMPQTVYMQRHTRHDHGFTVPDPVLTQREGIPNACNRCHTDKDAAWAAEAVTQWYGRRMERPSRPRAMVVAAGRHENDSGKAGLVALLGDATQSPYWKGVAADLLGRWAGADPAVAELLTRQLRYDDPLVRAKAATALRAALASPGVREAVQPLLDDPVRCVRVAAAGLLRADVDLASKAGRDLLLMAAQSADQPTGQLQAGMLVLERHGDAEAAARHLENAAAWDPRSAALRRELAVIYSSINRPQNALLHIQEACRLEPRNAEYQYLAGLASAALGQMDQTMAALERAVKLDPRHARAWYNLGLARRDAGQSAAALDALAHAQAADPTDPDPPFAAATIWLQLNRPAEARAAAERALAARPGYEPAVGFLRSMGKGP